MLMLLYCTYFNSQTFLLQEVKMNEAVKEQQSGASNIQLLTKHNTNLIHPVTQCSSCVVPFNKSFKDDTKTTMYT